MFVRNCMTASPVTLKPDTSAAEALRIMREKDYEGLPVVKGSDIVGVVTQFDILVALSNNCSSDFLDNTAVAELMTRAVETIGEDDIIEEAAYIMKEGEYSILPVVDEDGDFVGLIFESDVYEVFVEMLGLQEPGTRITLLVDDRVGVLADVAAVIKKNGISIASLATFSAEHGQMANVVVRLKTIDAHDVVNSLREAGFRVMHVSQVWR